MSVAVDVVPVKTSLKRSQHKIGSAMRLGIAFVAP